jgi:hypothetical protein
MKKSLIYALMIVLALGMTTVACQKVDVDSSSEPAAAPAEPEAAPVEEATEGETTEGETTEGETAEGETTEPAPESEPEK